MKPAEIVFPLLFASFAAFLLWRVARAVREEWARHREPATVDGHVQLFRADQLLTDAERRFAAQLEPALPEGCRLLAKCRMMELVRPVVPEHHRFHDTAKRLVLAKDVDFVIADRDWQVLCAVELDDRSHGRAERRARDRMVDAVFREAGVPLLRVRTDEDWRTEHLRQRIAQKIAKRGAVATPHLTNGTAAPNRRKPVGTDRE